MKARFFLTFNVFVLILFLNIVSAQAQDYVSPTKPAETGKSPGVKTKLVSTNGQTKNYVLIFSPGDEVVSGLAEFAQKYNVTNSHYTSIGGAASTKVGWFDYNKKMFKVIPVDTAEVTSFIGDIAMFNNKPVAHTHVSVATTDGIAHGGHLLEMIVGPTLELFVTVEPMALYKKVDSTFGVAVIDTELKE